MSCGWKCPDLSRQACNRDPAAISFAHRFLRKVGAISESLGSDLLRPLDQTQKTHTILLNQLPLKVLASTLGTARRRLIKMV